jgi:hypothetical protein
MSRIVHLLFALLLAASPVHAGSDDTCGHLLPASIDAPDDLRRTMTGMLQQSATFRQQCQRLDVPGLRVQIRPDVQLFDRPYRARSIIRRSQSGALTACVALAAFGNPTEWLAHEFEHIIEQLDGVRIPQLAMASSHDAWRSGDNMFETDRALRVGRLVLHEVQHAHRLLAHAAKSIEASARGDD